VSFYLEKDYFADEELFNLVSQVMQGNLTLHWFDAKTEPVRAVPSDPQRGLTYDDTNIGSYGYDAIAETLRNKYTMAPRGSEIWGRLPDLGYTINRKSDVWSENVARLYEEAKSRRWAPAVDVPWGRSPRQGCRGRSRLRSRSFRPRSKRSRSSVSRCRRAGCA